jgi:hypothetical protein
LASFEAEPGQKFDAIYETYSGRFQREDFGDEEKFDSKVLATSYLVPTEAELARQEGRDYEPASLLLERIRAARVAAASDSNATARRRRFGPTKKLRNVKKTLDSVSGRGRQRASSRS